MIEFADVSVRRGEHQALRGVSLKVASREIVALVGPSGSGKTTMLRLVNRLLEPQRGVVSVGDRPVHAWDRIALRRQTGYVIQDVGLFPHLTVAQNVAMVPRLLGMREPELRARTDELLMLVGLEPHTFAQRWPDQLSGGQQQRVGLARALAAHPPVLLMDEPFGAVDPITRVELHRQFKRLHAATPRTVLLVTHDLAEAFALADRIAVLDRGTIVACAPPQELHHAAHPLVQSLLQTRFE